MPVTSQELGTSLSYRSGAVRLAEIISAMTFALDMTEGAIPGHGLRTCLLGMRMAHALDLSEAQRISLYYALQLKDVGCSSNSSRVMKIMGGDDREIKAATKLEDWRKPGMSRKGLQIVWRNTLPEAGVVPRLARFMAISRDAARNREELIAMRCDRGAQILQQLAMDGETAEAVRSLDEHWDGGGYPLGKKGEEISLIARLCSIAQHLDLYASAYGRQNAMDTLEQRSGVWFDPELVALVLRLHAEDRLWGRHDMGARELQATVVGMDPGEKTELTPERVDRICEAFAAVVDAKSPFTFRHSVAVASTAGAVAKEMGLDAEREQLVRRAALLHDIGKLSVPNTILEKQSELTPQEWITVMQHPVNTRSVLERVSAFRELAVIASEHHERLDGTGYPWGLVDQQLSIESRIIALSDAFTAMVEDRPYREGMSMDTALRSLRDTAGHKVDAACFAALVAAIRAGAWPPEPAAPGAGAS